MIDSFSQDTAKFDLQKKEENTPKQQQHVMPYSLQHAEACMMQCINT